MLQGLKLLLLLDPLEESSDVLRSLHFLGSLLDRLSIHVFQVAADCVINVLDTARLDLLLAHPAVVQLEGGIELLLSLTALHPCLIAILRPVVFCPMGLLGRLLRLLKIRRLEIMGKAQHLVGRLRY